MVTAPGAALVTGGSRRIGRALALALAARGQDVAIHFNKSEEAAQETAATARESGVIAVALQADFFDEEAVFSLIGRARAAIGKPLTVLINNAALFERDRIENATIDGWRRHLQSNLQAPFFLTQAFARQAPAVEIDQAGEPAAAAVIINMVDQRVLRPTSEFASYTVSKAALWAMTQSSAVALAPKIRVNAIGPGPTIPSARQSGEHFARQRKNTLLGRGAVIGDVVAAMNCILDARSMTGQLICLDGGQFMRWNHHIASENQGF